jgi:RHH-type proline utilization regulon transcriptional repressor/proline dehydrogenase/delta 1-pyrroline-5-carboxylate dehydrogenase
MLQGALQELRIGNPDRLATDIGPVIDAEARQDLLAHIDRIKARAKGFYQLPLPDDQQYGNFVAPTVVEIGSLAELTNEVFGPVLHVLRYRRDELAQLMEAINASGYGLTLGIHSRLEQTADFIASHARVGNIYVNRNIIGAVVGVQPFGGEGKSGTGPKAGGPLYLKRLQRNPVIARMAPNKIPSATANALESLAKWAAEHGYSQVATLADEYLRTTPLGATLLLPGPTGERNTLSFAPRGVVLCCAAGIDALLNQLAAVLATGNLPALAKKTATLLPTDLPTALYALIQWVEQADATDAMIHLALAEAAEAPAFRCALAARDGALVALIETTGEAAIPLWRLVAERALSINTAAAGGNASLMAAAG